MIHLLNRDCMEVMGEYEDYYFDLAVVDPPYGIGMSKNPIRQKHAKKNWDASIPEEKYFTELMRVSKNQIIWGGNYFIEYLYNTQLFLIWDKKQPFKFSSGMVEMAWTSLSGPAKMFSYSVHCEQNKIHPTQKPVALFEYLIRTYTNEGDTVLDNCIGSGTTAIACINTNRNFIGIEKEEKYCRIAEERIHALRSPAQNAMEICHTAPNSAMLQGLKPHTGGTGTSA